MEMGSYDPRESRRSNGMVDIGVEFIVFISSAYEPQSHGQFDCALN